MELATMQNWNDNRLDEFSNRVEAGFSRLDGRLDRIDETLVDIKAVLGRMDERLARIDGRLDGIDARLDRVDRLFEQIDKRFDKRFAESTAAIEGLRAAIVDQNQETQGRVDRLHNTLLLVGGGLMGTTLAACATVALS
jgi:chromosome segregation ATPase